MPLWGIYDDEEAYIDMLKRTQPDNLSWEYPDTPNNYFPLEAADDDDEKSDDDWWEW